MKRTWPIIGVRDVATSSGFYLSLFGQKQRSPHHDDFDMISDADGTVLLCLREWAGHGADPPLQSPGDGAPGNGVLLFFRVDDFDDTLARACRTVGHFEKEPQVTDDGPGTPEFTVRDPDGYYVTVSAI